MKTQYLFLLFALLCGSALSTFVAKQSVVVGEVTYAIGNNDNNDCGVTRTESGTTLSYYYTSSATNADDCVGQNIFAFGSDIWVIITVTSNEDIVVAANKASSSAFLKDLLPVPDHAIVIAQIDSSSSATFGKFSWALLDGSVDYTKSVPETLVLVSATQSIADQTIIMYVNAGTGSNIKMTDYPFVFLPINGNGIKQVFTPSAKTLKNSVAPFVSQQSISVGAVTYEIGNKVADCGVTRTEGGTTVEYYYTSGASSADDCVGQNIFAIDSDIWVVLSVTSNQDILTSTNAASSADQSLWHKITPVPSTALALGKISTANDADFGKFSWALLDVGAIDSGSGTTAEPLEYVSATDCQADKTIYLTVNIDSQYGTIDYPSHVSAVNGNGIKQVFTPSSQSLTAYTAAGAPTCGGSGGSGSKIQVQKKVQE